MSLRNSPNVIRHAPPSPSLLVFRVGEVYDYRRFGQTLPKGAVPVGCINSEGELMLTSTDDIPVKLKRELLLLHAERAGATPYGEFVFTEDDIVGAVVTDLVQAAGRNKRSPDMVGRYRNADLVKDFQRALPYLRSLQGRIMDPVDVVVANFGDYDLLDVLMWVVESRDVLTKDDHDTFRQVAPRWVTNWWYWLCENFDRDSADALLDRGLPSWQGSMWGSDVVGAEPSNPASLTGQSLLYWASDNWKTLSIADAADVLERLEPYRWNHLSTMGVGGAAQSHFWRMALVELNSRP